LGYHLWATILGNEQQYIHSNNTRDRTAIIGWLGSVMVSASDLTSSDQLGISQFLSHRQIDTIL